MPRFDLILKKPSLLMLALILFCMTVMPSIARAQTPLKDGDRVVIYGDSITQQRLYSRYLQQY
ncbi:MAG: hypothetical protein ACF8OB_09440, partial [Phycisphaeraceae bacterium JB051]